MERILTVSAAALGSLIGLAPALAQESAGGSTGAGEQQQAMAGGGQSNASEVTCRELNSMDATMIPGVLYFVDGYAQAERAGGDSGSDGQAGGQESAQTGGQQGEQAGGQATEQQAGDQSGQQAGGQATERQAGGDSGQQAGDQGGEQGMHLVPVLGYFEIPIERTVIACADNPDSTVKDVIDQQRQSGSGG